MKSVVNGGLLSVWAEPAHWAYCARMAIEQVRRFDNCALCFSDDGDSDKDDEDEYIESASDRAPEDVLKVELLHHSFCKC